MPRHPSKTLTDGELRIMDVVWTLGEASVRDVTERLSQHDTVAYNTVLTMLGILKDKGYVRHRKSGRAFLYRPLVSREAAQRSALRHLVAQFFSGSPTAMVQNLLDSDEVDAMEIDRLRQLVDDAAALTNQTDKDA